MYIYGQIIYTAMKEIDFTIKAQACKMEELSEELQVLVAKAKENTERSYSPYSHFCVGAAILLEDGTMVNGANQENAAYPSGLCAERTAMFYANAEHPTQAVKAIAIACAQEGVFTELPGAPCGSCRQVLLETEHRFQQDIQVVLYGEKIIYVFPSAKSLLPYSFTSLY